MLSPWLGIVARLLTANPWRIGFFGLGLWLASIAALWYLHRDPEVPRKRSLGVSILVWTLTFVPIFVSTDLVTGAIIGRLQRAWTLGPDKRIYRTSESDRKPVVRKRPIGSYRWAAPGYFVFDFSSVAIKPSVECPSNSETSVKVDWALVNESAAANSFISMVRPVVA
jgi:hypothetical protein